MNHDTLDSWSANERIRAIAAAQRLVICALVVMILGRVAGLIVSVVATNIGFPVFVGVTVLVAAYVATFVFVLVAVFRCGRALFFSIGMCIVLILAMLVPLVNLFTLLMLSGNATNRLREVGVHVGFFGADLSQLP